MIICHCDCAGGHDTWNTVQLVLDMMNAACIPQKLLGQDAHTALGYNSSLCQHEPSYFQGLLPPMQVNLSKSIGIRPHEEVCAIKWLYCTYILPETSLQ